MFSHDRPRGSTSRSKERDPFFVRRPISPSICSNHISTRTRSFLLSMAAAPCSATKAIPVSGCRAGRQGTLDRGPSALPVFPCSATMSWRCRRANSYRAMSLGMHQRLPPAPARLGKDELRAYVAEHSRAADEKYAYLGLPGNSGPAFGRSTPLGAVVLLERADGQGRDHSRPSCRAMGSST